MTDAFPAKGIAVRHQVALPGLRQRNAGRAERRTCLASNEASILGEIDMACRIFSPPNGASDDLLLSTSIQGYRFAFGAATTTYGDGKV